MRVRRPLGGRASDTRARTSSRPSGSQALSRNMASIAAGAVLPRRRCAGRDAWRWSGWGCRARASRAGRPGRPRTGVCGVLADATMRAVGVQRARAVPESRADVCMTLIGGAVGQAFPHFGECVGPAEEGEAGDERGPGQVVEEQVQRRPGIDLLGQLLPRWPSAGCRRPGSRPAAAGPPARGPLRSLGCRASRPVTCVQVGLVERPRHRHRRGVQQVAGPALEVQVVAQPVGPGHQHGRRAAHRTGAARRWRAAGSRGRASARRHGRSRVRKSCFHVYDGGTTVATFGTLYSMNDAGQEPRMSV